ncbi:MAG: FxsA family protein [Alphaproteobacteria bacterium]|nr:MAG: FxsA family protein [Alphaproteobacteria bacterium]
MARFLFALILLVFTEIVVFVKVGERIGAFGVAGLTFLSAIVGLAIVRHQGLKLLERAYRVLAVGELPLAALGEGTLLAVAGLLLLLPGLVTDTVGALLLIPPLRRAILAALAAPTRDPVAWVELEPEDYDIDPARPDPRLPPWDDRP